ncbi:hypothetical protein V6N13_110835 [Hibiscus sabdariffa]
MVGMSEMKKFYTTLKLAKLTADEHVVGMGPFPFPRQGLGLRHRLMVPGTGRVDKLRRVGGYGASQSPQWKLLK